MKQLLIRLYSGVLNTRDTVINDIIYGKMKAPDFGCFEETVNQIINENIYQMKTL